LSPAKPFSLYIQLNFCFQTEAAVSEGNSRCQQFPEGTAQKSQRFDWYKKTIEAVLKYQRLS